MRWAALVGFTSVILAGCGNAGTGSYRTPPTLYSEPVPSINLEESQPGDPIQDTTAKLNEQGIEFHNAGQYQEALDAYNESLSFYPDQAHIWANRGRVYHNLRSYEAAFSDYGEAIQRDPEMAYAYRNRGLAYFDTVNYPSAMADFEKALELDSVDDISRRYVRLARGFDNIQKERYSEAYSDFDGVIISDPDQPMAYAGRGVASWQRGNLAAAVDDLSGAIRLSPSYTYALLNRASVYRQQNRFREAVDDDGRVLFRNPDNVEALIGRGNSYSSLGDLDNALADLKKALELDDNNISALHLVGLVYTFRQEFQQAIKVLSRASRLNDDAGVTLAYGRALFFAGRYTEAATNFNDGLESQVDEDLALFHVVWLYLARSYNKEYGLDELAFHSQRIDYDDWPRPVVDLFLGRTTPEQLLSTARQGNPQRARERLCEAHYYLGQLYLLQGLKAHAALSFRASVDTQVIHYIEYWSSKAELTRRAWELN